MSIISILFNFEEELSSDKVEPNRMTDEELNSRYEKGEARIVTEVGAIKLPQIPTEFKENGNYELKPSYQRRITWDNSKRSKLIESFIMNIPVPPIFIYEVDYASYQVMDGLQRITAIKDFYDNKFPLEGLTEWKELNGKYYSKEPKLPIKIKEGVDRRQLSTVTLLKESTKEETQEEEMKRVVFERLNTGGVKLEDQEIRNALYPGPFNNMCIDLSRNDTFCKLWDIPIADSAVKMEAKDTVLDYEDLYELEKNRLYMRMYDVELVLRFYSIRHLESLGMGLSKLFDTCLIAGNKYNEDQLLLLKEQFISCIEKAYALFGEKAFCHYGVRYGNLNWTGPQKMIYDPLMLALIEIDKNLIDMTNQTKNVELILQAYKQDESETFNGKKQGKQDIENRIRFYRNIITQILED